MTRAAQVLFFTVWIVGSLFGGLTVEQCASPSENEALRLLIDSEHARFGVSPRRIVLTVETNGPSAWRLAVPRPVALAPDRTEASDSPPEPETTVRSFVSFFTRRLPPP